MLLAVGFNLRALILREATLKGLNNNSEKNF